MKQQQQLVSVLFMLFSTLFTICLTAANIFAEKQFQVGIISFTGALFVFPVSYIINDVVAEVWGFRRARNLIWSAFGFNLFFVLMGALVAALPGCNTEVDKAFGQIFGLAPRIVIASMLAFLAGSFINATIMSKMKVRHEGQHFTLRAIASTLAGEACDSLIFFPIALGGIVPWEAMPIFVGWQVLLKTLYEIIILPVTICIVRRVKVHEQTDTFDKGISYNIF